MGIYSWKVFDFQPYPYDEYEQSFVHRNRRCRHREIIYPLNHECEEEL